MQVDYTLKNKIIFNNNLMQKILKITPFYFNAFRLIYK